MEPKRTIAPNVRIEITPNPEQYKQLCRDLQKLREMGALTNTAAILEAVGSAASQGRMAPNSRNGKGARTRPQPRNRKVTPDARQP